MVVHTCHLCTHEDEAGELPWVWGQFRLHSKYQTNQGYKVKLCLKTTTKRVLFTLSNNNTSGNKYNSGIPVTRSQVAQAALKLLNFLPQPPKCWGHRHTPAHLALQYTSNQRLRNVVLKTRQRLLQDLWTIRPILQLSRLYESNREDRQCITGCSCILIKLYL